MQSDERIERKRQEAVLGIRAIVRKLQADTHAAVKDILVIPDETPQFDEADGPPMPLIDVVIEVDAGDEARDVLET